VAAQWSRTAQELTDAIAELREISRGLHPAVLEKHGLAPALRELVRPEACPSSSTCGSAAGYLSASRSPPAT